MSQHQKALRLADELMQAHKGHADEGPTSFSEAAHELRTMQARIADLEAQLHAIGAISVKQSIRPQAQLPAPQQEPVAWRVHPFDYGVGSKGVGGQDVCTCLLIFPVDFFYKFGVSDIEGFRDCACFHAFLLEHAAHGSIKEEYLFFTF